MGDRPILTLDETRLLLAEYLPDEHGFDIAEVAPDGLVFTADPASLSTRPGGTVSGPAIFAFADVAAYLAVSAYLGKTPSAMLTSSSITFLEAAEPGELRARIEAVRIGRRTAVFTARVEDEPGRLVALATLHFSFPGRRREL
ncbi:PaaI family thioesterase [Streptomyces ureilyticus]|uniref:PaaI family thioesterase n=1 Tax=Streptomyces ureilyticus TaxID=1775131 RepID=A0ABX0DY55_9ACTN|nr:PaaI family thioesterase [Streptomyces ureilyticus]NGO45824.1 PaaI family thioesterase [Streptomyces ureilyticus]